MTAFYLVLAAFGAVAAAAAVGLARRNAQSFRHAARTLGLQTGPRAKTLDGEIDGCRVTARRVSLTDGADVGPELAVHPVPRLPADLAFGAEGLVQTVLRSVAGPDLDTGDKAFDDKVLIKGNPARVLATFDPATRRLVRRLVAEGVVLDGGELRITGNALRAEKVVDQIPAMVRAAKALVLPAEQIPNRLAERVERDPLSGVRQRALELLVSLYYEHPAAAQALEQALTDRTPAVRLYAMRHALPESEVAVEDALRLLVQDERLGTEERLEGLALYIEHFGHRRASRLLVALLGQPAMAGEAAIWLGRTGRVEALPALCAHLERARRFDQSAIIEAIGKLGDPRDPSAEAAILPLLDTRELQGAVVTALARVGTPKALPHLLPLTEGLLGGASKTGARQAIDAIRGRRGEGDGPGGLSVVETDPTDRLGRLSVAAETREGRRAERESES